MANKQDENTGPLEATIKNLKKEMNAITNSSGELQREWIKTQTELVTLATKTEVEDDKVKEQRAKETILVQRSLRFRNDIAETGLDIKTLRANIKTMHSDLAKLNELVAKNTAMQEEVANANYNLETEFVRRLEELELQGVEMSENIEKIKEEKEDTFQEIVEFEKQIMLWEKKILIERETQEALDPEYGQPEIKGMKKEMHRMRTRIAKLKRKQEEMIAEMERTISKRDNIRIAAAGAAAGAKRNGPAKLSRAEMKKKIAVLKKSLQKNIEESKNVEGDIAGQEQKNQTMLEELERQQGTYNELINKKNDFVRELDNFYFQRQISLENKAYLDNFIRLYEDARNNRYRFDVQTSSEATLLPALQAEEIRYNKLKDALQVMAQDNPKYAKFFQKLVDNL
jgi:myosin heavy subunit